MWTRHFASVARFARRTIIVLLIATALIPWTFGPLTPVGVAQRVPPVGPDLPPVQGEPAPGPAARLQLVVHEVHVRDDNDIGEGEMLLTVQFWRCAGPAVDCFSTGSSVEVARWDHSFHANDDDHVPLERVLPLAPDIKDSTSASEEDGFAVFAGQEYLLEFLMIERDSPPFNNDDDTSVVRRAVAAANGWGIGTYSSEVSGPNPHILCAPGCPGGDFDVTYEIRVTPWPDLVPTDIQIVGQPGPGTMVCVRVENTGQLEADAFEVNLRLDGTLLPTGYATGYNLAPGGSTEPCAKVDLPTSGGHKLQATVDEPQSVREQDESNNQLEQTFLFGPRVDTSGIGTEVVTVEPGADLPDLSVSNVLVQGKNPGGLSDCDQGKNTVVVGVANPAAVGGFAVRLVVDNQENQGTEVMVSTAPPTGRIIGIAQVPFADVNLNRGNHTLTATVDPHNTLAESNEDNNTLSVTVNCQDE